MLRTIRECLMDEGPGNDCDLDWHEHCVEAIDAALPAAPAAEGVEG